MLRVLHVEDDRVGALLFAVALAADPPWVDLRQAELGSEALALLADGWIPQLLVIDQHLPDGTGDQLLRQLRLHPGLAAVEAVLCTADDSPADRARASAAGFAAFWPKPVEPAWLRQALRARLTGRP